MGAISGEFERYTAAGLRTPAGFTDDEFLLIVRWLEDRGSSIDDIRIALEEPGLPEMIRSAIGTRLVG
jgi:hypothetical protein